SARPPDPGHPPRAGDPHPDLRAGLHLGRGSAPRGAGDQPDPELRVLGPPGGPAPEAAVRCEVRGTAPPGGAISAVPAGRTVGYCGSPVCVLLWKSQGGVPIML